MPEHRFCTTCGAAVPGGDATGVLVWGFSTLLGKFLNILLSSVVYSSLAARGRGEKVDALLGIQNGLGSFLVCFGTAFWVGLRLIPWVLLFVIPGIIKAYAWCFALPARMAGDVADAESAIQYSAEMTEGRKLYLFAYFLVLGLAAVALTFSLGMVPVVASLSFGADVRHATTVLVLLVQSLIAAVPLVGTWLAYADAVAPRHPASPAAPSAEDPWGRPYVLPPGR
ncbi:MAG: hypothetical protein HUU15_07795 [Candidatus Brocadiae bacterium]|nr:hypothetical protein [Candidatus Brocadiia bacterium]